MKDTSFVNKSHVQNEQTWQETEDDFVDESLVQLLRIVLPHLMWIVLVSGGLSLLVGVGLWMSPRQYQCRAVIAPDVLRDMSSVDLVNLTMSEEEQLFSLSQLAQLKTLAMSSQVKRGILEELELIKKWECESGLDCMRTLASMYNVKELRNVGLEIVVVHESEALALALVQSIFEQTNRYFKESMQSNARESVKEMRDWIQDVTKEIQTVSSEYISFASQYNIANLDNQISAASQLMGTIKQNIMLKEAEFAEKQELYGNTSAEIMSIKASLQELKKSLSDILYGKGKERVFPPLSEYEMIHLKVQEYQSKLAMLRKRLDLFTNQLATSQLKLQKQAKSIMTLDEPYVEPASKGTVKFTVLTAVGVGFTLIIGVILVEYFRKMYRLVYEVEES